VSSERPKSVGAPASIRRLQRSGKARREPETADGGRPRDPRAMTTDDRLDNASRHLLDSVRELRELEQQKRREPRSTDAFHRLAREAEDKSLEVWDAAREERALGDEPSPIPAEREQQEPGDWTK
jgi:hypothetical protein